MDLSKTVENKNVFIMKTMSKKAEKFTRIENILLVGDAYTDYITSMWRI